MPHSRSACTRVYYAEAETQSSCPACGSKLAIAGALREWAPPQDTEAEAAVLGAMLLHNEVMELALERLCAGDFHHPGHPDIFRGLRDIYVCDRCGDAALLREHLRRKGVLEKAGGEDYIDSLSSSASPMAEAESHVNTVRERSLARDLVEACMAILHDINASGNAFDLIGRAYQRIQGVTGRCPANQADDLMAVLDDAYLALEPRQRRPWSKKGLSSGFRELDDMTGGLHKSDLIILAGRPGVGKTAVALNIAEHIARKERCPTLIFSPGISKRQLGLRMLSTHCSVDFKRMLGGLVRHEDMLRIVEKGMGMLREAPIVIDDTPMISGMDLRMQARRMKAIKDIRFIVVTHAPLVSESTSEDRGQQVGKAVHSLKALARELAVPILVLLQTDPHGGGVVNAGPRLEDIPAAGVAEQDVDVAMILDRHRDEDNRYADDAVRTVVKQRKGPLDHVDLVFSQEYMRFNQVSPGAE